MSEKKMHYAWWIAASCCAIAFVGMGMFLNCAGIFLAPVAKSFGIGRGAFATYLSVQNIATMITLIFAGKIMIKVNTRVLLTSAVLISSLTYVAMSQLNNLSQFYIVGAIAGLSMPFCGMMIIGVFLNNWFKEKVGTVIGVAIACGSLGGVVFNPIGSAIILNYGWRTAYLSMGLIGLIILLPITLFVIRYKPSDIGMMPYGLKEERTAAQTTSATEETPGVTSARALKSVSFYFVFIYALAITCVGSFSFALPGYSASLGMSPTLGGTAASCILAGGFIGKLGIGYLNDKIGIVKTVTTAVIIGIIGIFLLMSASSVTVFLIGAFLLGFTFALIGVSPPLIVKQIFGLKQYGTIFSYVVMAVFLGGAVATPLYSYIYDVTKSYFNSLILALVVLVVGYICFIISLKTGNGLLPSEKKALEL